MSCFERLKEVLQTYSLIDHSDCLTDLFAHLTIACKKILLDKQYIARYFETRLIAILKLS